MRKNLDSARASKECYSGPILAKVRNVEELASCLSTGSKNRLANYQRNLSITRGLDVNNNFDSKVISVIERYALNVAEVRSQLRYLEKLKDEEGYSFSRCLKRYSTTQKAFELFASRDHTSFRWNQHYQEAIKMLKGEFSKFSVKPLSITCDSDVLEALPKANTHSGYTFIETGIKKKGDNMEGVFLRYSEALEAAKSCGSFRRPIMIAFRTQASGEYSDDGQQTFTCKHKTRVVSMVDLLQIIAELKFSNPIQHVMGQMTTYAGGKDDHTLAQIISGYRYKFNQWCSIDYSSYDQTISSWLIEDAFDVLKSCFNVKAWTQDIEDEWDLVVHDFIHKDFIISEGLIHSDKGVPSGSMFTQIIDTVANWIMILTYSNSVNMRVGMLAMGDDNLIFSYRRIVMSELSSYLRKNFGVIIHDDDKTNFGSRSEPPKFLSCFWKISGKWRHPNQILSRLAYSERFRLYNHEVTPELVVYGYILTYPKGMVDLIDVDRFMNENRFAKEQIMKLVDSYQVLPGSMAYQVSYGLVA